MFQDWFLPRLVWLTYVLFYKSWRIRYHISPGAARLINEKKSFIFAHWHGDELPLLHMIKIYQLATMISTSKDGTLMNFVVSKFDGVTTRGSSTRGGASALRGLIRLIRENGKNTCMAVDGPRGPIYEVKPGAFELSRLCGAAIIPLGITASPVFISKKSWNQAQLPWLFSRVEIVMGEPMPPLQKSDDCKDIKLAEQLREMIFDAKRHSANIIAQGHSG